jgi:hydroxymethylpyrimidine pyrophosphatase-like HAD family hydrolase
MNIACFQFATGSLHFIASIETLLLDQSNRNKIYYRFWAHQTSYPNRMAMNFNGITGRYPKKFNHIFSSLNFEISKNLEQPNVKAKKHTSELQNKLVKVKNLSDLKNVLSLEKDLMSAIINELTTTISGYPENLEPHIPQIHRIIHSYIHVFYSVIDEIRKLNLDKVIIFNGRFLHEKAVESACRATKTEAIFYETLRNRIVISGKNFHNREQIAINMFELWNSFENSAYKEEIGEQYFERMRSKNNIFFISNPENLGEILENDREYVVFYTSSDDEIAGLWDENSRPLGEQVDAINKLIEYFKQVTRYKLIIRIHPNLINKSKTEQLRWSKFEQSENIQIIAADKKIDSYELMMKSSGVMSYGSTIGLEAAYNKIPSAVLCHSFYDLLGPVDLVLSIDDLTEWIEKLDELSDVELNRRKTSALIRGFYMSKAGIHFTNAQIYEVGEGSWRCKNYLGFKIEPSKFLNIYYRIIYHLKLRRRKVEHH